MIRVVVALAIVLGAVALDPGAPFGSTHRTAFPAIDGDPSGSIDIDRLPLTLVDLTGRVTSIESNDWIVRFDDSTSPFLQLGSDPRSVRVYWLGGACSAHVRAALVREGADGVRLIVDEEPELGLFVGCPAVGVPRRLTLRFATDVNPMSFVLEYRPG